MLAIRILALISKWSQNNLDVVFFVYGLAFVAMGIAIWVQPKQESKFKIAHIFWLLSGFGLIHGATEFLDLWAIIKGRSPALDVFRSFILLVSYIFLFEFGRRLLRISAQRGFEKIISRFGWWLTFIFGFSVLTFGFLSNDFWKIGTIWARYLLGFPGGLLIAFGFISYYQCEKQNLVPLKIRRYFLSAGFFFLLYGILAGWVVPKAGFFPSRWLNTDSFLSVVGIPVQIFRALSAIIITWSVCSILRIFNWETRKQLQESFEQLKQAQSQLIQSEKMAGVGRLASGVAHEINNPLFVITGEAEMLQMNNKEIAARDAIKIILEQSKRIKDIIDRLLQFSRQKEFKREPLDVNTVIEESISFLSYQINLEEIKIVKDFATALPQISGNKSQLEEVFVNIMLNAVEAMENRGSLFIRTFSEETSENRIGKIDKFKAGQRIVIIEFKDTGGGIEEQALEKIFEPFFTTKDKGVGLGLHISYGIITNHGGIIEAQSKPAEGATFLIKLPIAKGGEKK